MTDFLIKKYGRKVFASQAINFEPIDPHYETYINSKGKIKSRKRALPIGLNKHEIKILKSVRRRAHYLDKGFNLCGFKFGWSAIFGLIPFLGDIISFLLSYFLVFKKIKEIDNLPFILQQRMTLNMTISIGVGMVPLVGDIILAIYKANSRNAALLEEFLIARVAEHSNKTSAEIALAAPGINSSGERIESIREGTTTSQVIEEEGGKKKKKKGFFYGWGKDSDETGNGETFVASGSRGGEGGGSSTAVIGGK